ncbi:unnamed protein product [Choristocarpus tenellus]
MGSISQEDREERFKHLLQPLRDLAQNWDIDIASSLEDYLEDLEGITISLDGGASNVNFAEAALLIQGSTSVYSRKVEHVYQLVLQTIDFLTQQSHTSNSGKAGKGGDDHDPSVEETAFLLLDDVLEEGEGIDLDPTKELRAQAGRGSRRSMDSGRSSTGKAISRPPMFLMEQDYGNSFKMSTCAVDASGALLIEGAQMIGSSGRVPTSFLSFHSVIDAKGQSRRRTSVPDFWGGLGEGKSVAGWGGGGWENDGYNDDDSDEGGDGGFGDSHQLGVDDNEVGQDFVTSHASNLGPSTPKASAGMVTRRETGAIQKQSAFDEEVEIPQSRNPWDPLDPHDPGKAPAKPIRKGRPYRLPKGLKKARGVHQGATLTEGVGEEQESGVDKFVLPAPLHGLGYPEFQYVERRERQRKALENRMNLWSGLRARDSLLRASLWLPPSSGGDDAAHSNGYDQFSDDGGGFGGGFSDDGDDDHYEGNFDGVDFGTTQEGEGNEGAGGGVGVPPISLEDAFRDAPQTYEDLCRSHIEAFMRGTEHYAHETQLSRRVGAWQNKLEPLMRRQEKREAFDIHRYSQAILGRVTTVLNPSAPKITGGKKTEVKLGDICRGMKTIPKDAIVPFAEVVAGREQFDVCRLFLASLQLANNGNVRLRHGDNALEQESTAFELELMSLKAAHNMDGSFAPMLASQPAV